MICPKCQQEVEMLKFTAEGVMCRSCHHPFTDSIEALESRIKELEVDRDLAIEHEAHNRIRGDQCLIDAYRIAIKELKSRKETQ